MDCVGFKCSLDKLSKGRRRLDIVHAFIKGNMSGSFHPASFEIFAVGACCTDFSHNKETPGRTCTSTLASQDSVGRAWMQQLNARRRERLGQGPVHKSKADVMHFHVEGNGKGEQNGAKRWVHVWAQGLCQTALCVLNQQWCNLTGNVCSTDFNIAPS